MIDLCSTFDFTQQQQKKNCSDYVFGINENSSTLLSQQTILQKNTHLNEFYFILMSAEEEKKNGRKSIKAVIVV